MLTGLFRYGLCLILITQSAYSNSDDNCTASTCPNPRDDVATQSILRRTKRAIPAQCDVSSDEEAYTLAGSFCCDSMIPLIVDNQLSTTNGMGAISRVSKFFYISSSGDLAQRRTIPLLLKV
ncbi:hypothetical protein OESDEN_16471 [Oesophagostomum dentatum]|uniref:Uncharacterized protein n=1 Tax=Oesophagostomum dentatum TaxID=61180 RepID=A0A0B1SKT2_OESDE|nr:hypothetical protein OESDEN_16471 [Oesophagostomum dentatum]